MRVITREYPADWDYLNLYPISDTHLGSEECMEDKLEKYVAMIAQDDRAAVVLAGDIINNGLKSSKTNVYEEKIPSEGAKAPGHRAAKANSRQDHHNGSRKP